MFNKMMVFHIFNKTLTAPSLYDVISFPPIYDVVLFPKVTNPSQSFTPTPRTQSLEFSIL